MFICRIRLWPQLYFEYSVQALYILSENLPGNFIWRQDLFSKSKKFRKNLNLGKFKPFTIQCNKNLCVEKYFTVHEYC